MTELVVFQEGFSYTPTSIIELYKFDLTSVGAGTLYYTNETKQIVFMSQVWTPLPIEMTNIEKNSSGAPTRPTLRVSNLFKTLQASTIAYQDLVNCRVIRYKTFAKFIQGGSSPNDSATISIENFIINQLTELSPDEITWELCTSTDIEDDKIPARQMLRQTLLAGTAYEQKGFPGLSVSARFRNG
jgi:lambda family phage minor tail protein L